LALGVESLGTVYRSDHWSAEALPIDSGDTRFILLVTSLTSPQPVIAAWWGTEYQGWGVIWCRVVHTAWVCGLGLISTARVLLLGCFGGLAHIGGHGGHGRKG
jgi:hypothetical protein